MNESSRASSSLLLYSCSSCSSAFQTKFLSEQWWFANGKAFCNGWNFTLKNVFLPALVTWTAAKQILTLKVYKFFCPFHFPGSSVGKEYTCNAGDPSSIRESGRLAGEGIGYPLQYSWASLVVQLIKNPPAMQETWVNPWVEEVPWRRERLPTPVFWPGEFHGLYSSWDRKESDAPKWLSPPFTSFPFSLGFFFIIINTSCSKFVTFFFL